MMYDEVKLSFVDCIWVVTLLSETHVGEEVLASDDALELAVGWIEDHHVTHVVDAELVKDLVKLVMHADGHWALNHVGAKIDPLVIVLLDDVKDHLLAISFSRVDIAVEFSPR